MNLIDITSSQGWTVAFIAIGLFAILLPIWCLYDIIKGNSASTLSKPLWIIVVLIFPILGPVLYYVSRRRR
jgi:Phospholipase_D-nuclease N-terminal